LVKAANGKQYHVDVDHNHLVISTTETKWILLFKYEIWPSILYSKGAFFIELNYVLSLKNPLKIMKFNLKVNLIIEGTGTWPTRRIQWKKRDIPENCYWKGKYKWWWGYNRTSKRNLESTNPRYGWCIIEKAKALLNRRNL
jgi:hypothetical protein